MASSVLPYWEDPAIAEKILWDEYDQISDALSNGDYDKARWQAMLQKVEHAELLYLRAAEALDRAKLKAGRCPYCGDCEKVRRSGPG